eukprot:CAMPEP_0197036212 /NCGR_PEP_ID=MMETSP1384-20130603/13799_1 /TAXON_ID=29189 /ORGANISM="Ammonia sp." /LENGTH=134 /DNA_ID=CAMNT_0042466371 /DNA_START=18 /DNA_END=419 /DNA_ORIENTATION=+
MAFKSQTLICFLSLFNAIKGQCESYTKCEKCTNDDSPGFVNCQWHKTDEYCYNWYDNPNDPDALSFASECPSTVAAIVGGVVGAVALCCCVIIYCAVRSHKRASRRSKHISKVSATRRQQPPSQPAPPQQQVRV